MACVGKQERDHDEIALQRGFTDRDRMNSRFPGFFFG